jgi:hypothetical protein
MPIVTQVFHHSINHQSILERHARSPSTQQIPQLIHIRHRHDLSALGQKLLLPTHAGQNRQRPAQAALDPEPNIRIQPIADHTRAVAIEAKLALNSIHHGLARFPERQGLAAEGAHERGPDGAGAGEQGARAGEGGIGIGGEEKGAAVADVGQGEGVLAITGVKVEAGEDDGDVRVEGVAGGDGGEIGVRGRRGVAEGRVRAADVGDALGRQLGFDAGFAEDEDFVAGRLER